MPIELTAEQHAVLEAEKNGPPHVIDPQSQQTFVLVPLADYESVRDLLEEDQDRKAVAAMAAATAGAMARRLQEEP